MHTPISALRTPVTAYKDLTKSDLQYMGRHAKRIAKALQRRYEALGGDRAVIKKIEVPKGRVTSNETPHMVMNFMREQENGEFLIEATLTVDLTVIKPRSKAALAVFDLKKDPDVKERQLVLYPVLTRSSVRDEITLDVMRMGTAPSAANFLFHKIASTGLIECPDHAYIAPHAEFKVPNDPIFDHFAPDRYELDDTDASLPKKPHRRREWDSQEKYLHKKMVKLREIFLRETGHIFKRLDFSVNPHTGTFRLAFYARNAFEGRFIKLEGRYNLVWDAEHDDARRLDFTVIKGAVCREFNPAARAPIDMFKCDAAHEQILAVLRDECHFDPHARALEFAKLNHAAEALQRRRKRPSVVGGERRHRHMESRRMVAVGMP